MGAVTRRSVAIEDGTLDRVTLIVGTVTVTDSVNVVLGGKLRAAGQVGVARATELEVRVSARRRAMTPRPATISGLPFTTPVGAEQRGRELQAHLVRHGQRRGVSIPDLITELTGQPTEWVVPRGSLD